MSNTSALGGYGGQGQCMTLFANQNCTLDANIHGMDIFVPQATANNTITMPALTRGLRFNLILTAAANGTNTWTFTFPSAKLNRNSYAVAAAIVGTSATAATSLTVSATAANTITGDKAEVTCDGAFFYARTTSAGTASAWGSS